MEGLNSTYFSIEIYIEFIVGNIECTDVHMYILSEIC